MASFAAALLDELMGRNRNNDPNEKPKDLNWADPEVCKHYLCSFCPHELFTNTKADLGLCNKIHDDELARNYRKSTRYMKMGYEAEFLVYLEGLANEVDRRIKRGHARLALNATHMAQQAEVITQAQEERIKVLTEEINRLVEQAEQQGCEGLVEEAKLTMKKYDQKQEERKFLEESKNQPQNLNAPKEMEVCEICGAFLVVGDAIQRVEEHLQGKQHIGYARVREAIVQIRSKMKGEDPERETRLKKEREEREKVKEKEREEEKQREAERDKRRREKDEDDKNRDRHRNRSRSRSRHSRSKRDSRSRHTKSEKRSNSRHRSRSGSRGKKSRKERRRSRDGRDRSHERQRSSRDRRDRRSKDDRVSESRRDGEKRRGSEERRRGASKENGSDRK